MQRFYSRQNWTVVWSCHESPRQSAKTRLVCAQTNGEDGRSKCPKAILSIGTKGEESGLSRKGEVPHLIVSTVKDVNVLKHEINLYYKYINANFTIDRNQYIYVQFVFRKYTIIILSSLL